MNVAKADVGLFCVKEALEGEFHKEAVIIGHVLGVKGINLAAKEGSREVGWVQGEV